MLGEVQGALGVSSLAALVVGEPNPVLASPLVALEESHVTQEEAVASNQKEVEGVGGHLVLEEDQGALADTDQAAWAVSVVVAEAASCPYPYLVEVVVQVEGVVACLEVVIPEAQACQEEVGEAMACRACFALARQVRRQKFDEVCLLVKEDFERREVVRLPIHVVHLLNLS